MNMTTMFSVLAIATLIITLGVVPVVQATPADKANDTAKNAAAFVLPEHATEIAPGVYSLGTAIHNGKMVEGVAVFHHRAGHDGGPGNGGPGDGTDDETNTCYSSFTKGAIWRTEEPWNINTSNNAGLDTAFLKTDLADDMTVWETSDGTTNYAIFGNLDESIIVDDADTQSPDGKNEILFRNIEQAGAIAVTITWFERTGHPAFRDIVEWDQVYDDEDFEWSSDGAAGTMDFANIATHELGHALGLGHPDSECTEETMYAFAKYGETKKRDLNAGDIAGVQDMYN